MELAGTCSGSLGINPVSIHYNLRLLHVASFPGLRAAFSCTRVLQATKSWAGPGNEAMLQCTCIGFSLSVVMVCNDYSCVFPALILLYACLSHTVQRAAIAAGAI